MLIMTFDEVINTIENKRRFGKACGRDVTAQLMDKLGHPEAGMQFVHIAGTNGKGSVAAFVSSVLQAASFSSESVIKVGTFTSPHLIDFTERIKVDGQQISQADATRIGEYLLNIDIELEPTMFDYCLAIAMIYFKEQGVTHVVLETGLGGSKDSTSGLAIVPAVCAITSIGLEHTAILGDTIEQIAMEKAGIIKSGTKVVIGKMPETAGQVIMDRCSQLDVPYVQASAVGDDVELGLFGYYQRMNADVAKHIIELLDIEISDSVILRGLKDAKWPGRMDIISSEPFIMLDGAHNPQGVMALKNSLVAEFPDEKFTFVMAVMADKDYVQMADIVGDIGARFYTCTVDYSRALQSDTLAKSLEGKGYQAKAFEKYEEALNQAKENPEKIVVFGSLYFIGEILKNN